jgi:two-component system sensor histidine kinase/response regulator
MQEAGRILVVDDKPRNLRMISSILGATYEMIGVGSGQEALDVLHGESGGACCDRPDIVLLDATMPKMSGFEVCRKLRDNPSTAHIPVAIITSLDSLKEKVRAMESGADDLISRPLDQVELRARVQSMLRVSRLRLALDEAEKKPSASSRKRSRTDRATFAREIVHDLRGPLSGIIGNAQLLQARAATEDFELTQLAVHILDASRLMHQRLSDILDICLFEEKKRDLRLDKADVRAAADVVLNELSDLADANELNLELEPAVDDASAPRVFADADAGLLLRIIGNLIVTGIHHTPPGGTVRVVVGKPVEGRIEVHVVDTGEIIDGDLQNAVFETGIRAAKKRHPKTPLDKAVALNFCKLAIEAHGGRLWLEENASGGNTFGFILPEAK